MSILTTLEDFVNESYKLNDVNYIMDIIKSDKAYDILDGSLAPGTTFQYGGCWILADTLSEYYGVPVNVVLNGGVAEHFVVRIGSRYMDSDGVQSSEQVITKIASERGCDESDLDIVKYNDGIDTGDIIRDTRASRKLVRLFRLSKVNDFVNEAVNDKSRYFGSIGMSTEDAFDLIDYTDSYRNLYPGYDDESDNEYETEYYFGSMDEAYADVNDVLGTFDDMDESITIYRTVEVDSVDDVDMDNLGDSWSSDRESAINFAYNNNDGNVLITATTDKDNIDWEETVRLYYKFSRGGDSYDENELRVIDADGLTNINITSI